MASQGYAVASPDSAGLNSSVTFDPIFLAPGLSQKADLERFEKGAYIFPGTYDVDVFVNNKNLGKNTITFKTDDSNRNDVLLCMTSSAVGRLNLNFKELNAQAKDELAKDGDICHNMASLLPELKVDYDSGSQRLDLTIPQVYLRNTDNGYVDPEFWDSGVNALMVGYQSNYYTMSSRGNKYDSAFIGLNTGFNIGAWQLRHNGNYNWQSEVGGEYQRINTYLQRDIPSLKSRIIIGENNSNGQVFDTSPFRGVRLSDVENMLPSSERGYAPEIRGIARTNAKVTIRQNGQILRETTVVPGAFNINDLYPTGYGGDLDVTVTESDGSVQTFSVPYSAVSILLRPGAYHYDVIMGETNYVGYLKKRPFYQATLQYGINNALTGYGGFQSSNDDYYSVLAGAGFNTPVGALSVDVTHAETRFDDSTDKMAGQSYRLSFSKRMLETKSSVSIAAYRYSTSGYLDYNTAMSMMNLIDNGRSPNQVYRPKNRFSTTFSQGLPDGYGQLYVTGYTQDYWNSHTHSDLQYQLGYNNNFRNVTFGLNAGRTRNSFGRMETTSMVNVSIPFGSTSTVTGSLTRDSSGHYGQQVSVSGVAGDNNTLSYGVSGSHYGNDGGSSATASGSYRSSYSNLSASVSSGKNYTSGSVGATGTLLGYSGGIVLSPYTSDTFAIVEAKGAKGAKVSNYPGISIDRFGHAAVPYLSAYQMNEISIDPKGISQDVELNMTSQSVTPYNGAVIKLKYDTNKAIPVLFTLNGSENIPFGTNVSDNDGNSVGIIGQGGQLYARLSQAKGILRVKWGTDSKDSCDISYSISQKDIDLKKMLTRTVTCSS